MSCQEEITQIENREILSISRLKIGKVSDCSPATLKTSNPINPLIMLGPCYFTLFYSSMERNIWNKNSGCHCGFCKEVEDG